MEVGNGQQTLFWADIWLDVGRLKDVCPRLFAVKPEGVFGGVMWFLGWS